MSSRDMTFARSGLGYVGLWDVGGVEVALDHLRRRSGDLHGELTVSSAVVPRGYGHLHRASFNVSSSKTRSDLTRVLNDRSRPNELAWGDMLEEFCTAVLDAERTGSPVISVGNLPPVAGESFLIDSFLPAGKVTIVYGAGGTGKSYLADLAAVAVATGQRMLRWRSSQGPVLYLDWETDAYEIDERVKRVANGLGVPSPEILYRSCAGTLDEMAEDVARRVADKRIQLVIVDSVGMASGAGREGGDANESALRLFGALRHIGSTVLAIDHVTGEDVRSDKAVAKPYGSIYKVNLARSVWELRRADESANATLLGLFHRKVNKGRLQDPVGVRVEHGSDAVRFYLEEVQDPSLVVALGNGPRIERVLTDGPMTTKDIAEETGISEAVVRVTLNRGRARLFAKVDDGRWALARNPFRNGYAEVHQGAA